MGINKIGILGGTFDPIHAAHIKLAEIAMVECNLDKVLFIPAGNPWMKKDTLITSPIHRLNMVNLAIGNNSSFCISDIEIKRLGNTYTIDTLKELGVDKSQKEYHLILGSDSYKEISRWKNPEEIIEIVRIILFTRKGDTLPETINHTVTIIDEEIEEISSTLIRKKVQTNDSLQGLVPKNVEEYIFKNNLYKKQV